MARSASATSTAPENPAADAPATTDDVIDLDDFWSFDDAPDQTTYVYRLDESGHVRPSSIDGAYECRITGPIDPEIVKSHVGGGRFRLIVKRGRTLIKRFVVRIAGDPQGASAPPPPPAPAPAAFDPNAFAQVIAQSIGAVLDAKFAVLAPPKDTLAQALEIVRVMREAAPAPAASAPPIDAATLVQQQLDMFHRGYKTARDMTGSAEGGRSMGDALVEVLPRALETVDRALQAKAAVDQLRAHRASAPARPAPAPAPANGSVAQVVNDEPAAASGAEEDPVVEWADALIGIVARGLRQQIEPEDLADTIELLLDEPERATLLAVPEAVLLEQLELRKGQHPELGSPQLREYVTATLEALRSSPDDEPGDASPRQSA